MNILLSIEEVKNFLKITDKYDEDLLLKIISYTQELLEKNLDQKLSSLLKDGRDLPGDLKLIWLSYIAHIYDQRTLEKISDQNSSILAKYQKIYF